MAPQTGLEPVTYGLTVRRSTNWTIGEACYFKFVISMAPQTGLEPVTYGLTVRRSTNWTIGELFR
jgi:hypothetical protein